MADDKALQEARARYEKAKAEADDAKKAADDARARAKENEGRLKEAQEKLKKAREERKGGIGKAEKELKEAEGPEKEAAKAEKAAESKERAEHLSAIMAADSHKHGEHEGCVTRCIWDKAQPPTWRRKCVFKGHNHRENGVKYQLANEADWYSLDFRDKNGAPRKRLNQQFSDAQLGRRKTVNNPTISKDCWWMSNYGVNFRTSSRPWENDAHHLIPIESLATFFGDKLLVLQAAKYNINTGVNIMMLPTQEKYGRIYQLPIHPSNHPDYNEAVKRQLKGIKNNLNKRAEASGGHPDLSDATASAWKEELNNFSLDVRPRIREKAVESFQSNLLLHINDALGA